MQLQLKSLKSRHSTALLTIHDLPAIYALMDIDDAEKAGDSSDCVQWTEDGHIDDTNIAALSSEKWKESEQYFALVAFLYGYCRDRDEVMSG